jgi:hypothetical protein
MYHFVCNSPFFVMLGSCVTVVLSDKHASTSVISTVGLGGLNAGKAAAVFSSLGLEAFLGEAFWSRTGKGIMGEDEGGANSEQSLRFGTRRGVF